MADSVTREFILEQFRENRRLHDRTAERLDRIEHRLDSMGEHVATLVKSDFARDADFAALEARVERIERRLELTNGAEG